MTSTPSKRERGLETRRQTDAIRAQRDRGTKVREWLEAAERKIDRARRRAQKLRQKRAEKAAKAARKAGTPTRSFDFIHEHANGTRATTGGRRRGTPYVNPARDAQRANARLRKDLRR